MCITDRHATRGADRGGGAAGGPAAVHHAHRPLGVVVGPHRGFNKSYYRNRRATRLVVSCLAIPNHLWSVEGARGRRGRVGLIDEAMLVAAGRWWSRLGDRVVRSRCVSSISSPASWVLHRDDDVLVLDKPPGVPMRSVGSVLGVDAVLSDLKFDLRHPPMTVHRLSLIHI